MTEKTKQVLISAFDTFIATFAVAALLIIEPAISAGQVPTKEILISAAAAGMVAGSKAAIKRLREYLVAKKESKKKSV